MFLDLAKKRRSIRSYTEEKISAEDWEVILSCALRAPSAKNARPVEMIVVEDKETLANLGSFKERNAHFLPDAAGAIVVVVDREKAPATYEEDASIVCSYIELAAADVGLGSCWVNAVGNKHSDGRPSGDVLKEMFGVAENYEAIAVIALGHPSKHPGERTNVDENHRIHKERFRG